MLSLCVKAQAKGSLFADQSQALCFSWAEMGRRKEVFIGNLRLCAFPLLKWEAVFAVQSQAARLSCAEMGRRNAVVQSQTACFSCAEMGRRNVVFAD